MKVSLIPIILIALIIGICSPTFAGVPPSHIGSGQTLRNVIAFDSIGFVTSTGTMWLSSKMFNFSTDTSWVSKLFRSDSMIIIQGNDTIKFKASGLQFGTSTRKFYTSPDTSGFGGSLVDTGVFVIRDKRDTAFIRTRPVDSTLEISFNFGTTWHKLFSFIKADTVGDDSGIKKIKFPALIREGNNISLNVTDTSITINSTGGGGDDIWADSLGSGFGLTNVSSPVVIQVGSGIGMSIVGPDTIRIRALLGPTVDSSEMAAGLAGARNNSINSDKIVDLSIVAADIANGTITGSKIASETVTSSNILNGDVAYIDLGVNSVDSNKVVNKGLSTSDYQDTSITTAKIKDLNVTSNKIAAGAVGSGQLSTGGVGTVQLSDGGVALIDLGVNSVNSSKVVDLSLDSSDIAQNFFLRSNRPDTLTWNSAVSGSLVLSVLDTVNRNTGVKVVQDSGAKFQVLNLSTADSSISQIELKFRQTGTSQVNLVGRNLGASESRFEIFTEHATNINKRLEVFGVGTTIDTNVIGTGTTAKLMLRGGTSREVIVDGTLVVMDSIIILGVVGSGRLNTDSLQINTWIKLNADAITDLTGPYLQLYGTQFGVDTGGLRTLLGSGGGTGTGLDTLGTRDTAQWTGSLNRKILRISQISTEKTQITGGENDTLIFGALTPGTSMFDSIGRFVKAIEFGAQNNTTTRIDSLLADSIVSGKGRFGRPRYTVVPFANIYFRRTAPSDSLYATLGHWIDTTTGVVWDVTDSTKTAAKVDFIYASIIFTDTMVTDTLHYTYITSGADSSGAMIDSIRIYKEYSPTSGVIDSSMSNTGVKKTGNTASATTLVFSKGVQPGERWTVRFRMKLTAANSFVRLAGIQVGGREK